MSRETHSFEISIEGELQHIFIGQRGGNVCRYFFAESQIDHMDFTSIHGIAEEKHLEVRVFRVFVNTALV